MKIIDKLFDEYSFNARVKPAFFLLFPVVLSVVVWYEPSRTLGGAIITFISSFGILSFAASQMSTRGNILQEELFKRWGGAPTTLVLRHTNNRLDRFTKERYKQRLESLISNFKAFDIEQEKSDPESADEMYASAGRYLNEYTKDVKKYPLVFKENIAYGFSRNILACKSLGIFLTLISLLVSAYLTFHVYLQEDSNVFVEQLISIPFVYTGLIVTLVLILFCWLFMINVKWVEVRAYAYARAVYAVCEKIPEIKVK